MRDMSTTVPTIQVSMIFLSLGHVISFSDVSWIKERNVYRQSEISEPEDVFTDAPARRTRKVIFLISSKRSGSSFVGEYFNKHSEIFYMFEPLQMLTFYVLNGKINNSAFDDVALDIIRGLIDCQFDHGYRSPVEWLTRKAPLCVFNQELQKSDICSEDHAPYNVTEVASMLTEICQTKRQIAFKLIRIQDLEVIKPLVMNKTIDAKVLYLIRDPRGTINSRNIVELNYDLIRRMSNTSLEVEDVCWTIERNLKYYWFNTPSWLKGRLKVIRYEDVALNPIDVGKEIFDFVGSEFDTEVIKWLFMSTRNQQTAEGGKGHLFRTSRDSAQRVTGWRKEMSWARVSSIQRKCVRAMEMAGYLPITSEIFLRNLQIPSLIPYRPAVNSTG